MMEAIATESAGQASLRHPGAFMVPLRRSVNLDAGRALVGRVEDYHEVPNVIPLKGPSGTGSLPMPDLVDYVSRIQELRSFGEEEDIIVSRDSESDFLAFRVSVSVGTAGELDADAGWTPPLDLEGR